VPGFICKPINSTRTRYVCRHESNEPRRSNSNMRVVPSYFIRFVIPSQETALIALSSEVKKNVISSFYIADGKKEGIIHALRWISWRLSL
jgi:hypothetical protein